MIVRVMMIGASDDGRVILRVVMLVVLVMMVG